MLATVLQWLVLASVTGAIVGTGTSLFLHGLFFMTDRTAMVPFWLQMLLLPAGGLLNGLLLHYGYRFDRTGLKDTVMAAVHTQAGRMPFLTMPIKPLAAIITLASGGSAGKEGPCSHIGASLAAAIGQVLHLNTELRQRIVACGVSAGFASVFGTPIAGAIYGVEVLAIGRIRHDFLFPAIVAGVVSYQVSLYWGVPYQYYHFTTLPEFSELLFLKTLVLGALCGLVALVFVEFVHRTRGLFARLRARFDLWPPLMPLGGGVLLSLLILVIPTDYLGLSLPLMDRALGGEPMPYLGFLWKSLLVAVTIGSGFYGGIVTPQFVIGTVAGNAFAHLFGLDRCRRVRIEHAGCRDPDGRGIVRRHDRHALYRGSGDRRLSDDRPPQHLSWPASGLRQVVMDAGAARHAGRCREGAVVLRAAAMVAAAFAITARWSPSRCRQYGVPSAPPSRRRSPPCAGSPRSVSRLNAPAARRSRADVRVLPRSGARCR